MNDINVLLAKHFSDETSPVEELQVKEYIQENPKEYRTMKKLWFAEGLKVRSFNESKAWKRIRRDATQAPPTSYRIVQLVVLMGIILLISLIAKQFITKEIQTPLLVQVGTDEHEVVTLSDGSKVHLNEGAQFRYPASFDGIHRKVSLEGEAYFEIERDVNHPFIIETKYSAVEVLGTSFNINSTDYNTDVAVTSGIVSVTAVHNNESAILIKDQAALITSESVKSYSLKNQNFLGWKTGVFTYSNQPIAQVVNELNKYYDDRLLLTKVDSDCLLSANLSKNTLPEIIEIIELTCQLSINQTSDSYELY